MNPSQVVPRYVLAGGSSQRFAGDKARTLRGDQPQLNFLLGQLSGPLKQPTHVVADRANRFQDLGIESLVDNQANAGPLAGVQSALQHRQSTMGGGWIVVVNCDLVSWSTDIEIAFSDALAQAQSARCIAFVDSRNLLAPLPCMLHTDMLHLAEERLALGLGSLAGLLDACDVMRMPLPNPNSIAAFNTLAEFKKWT